MTNYHHNDTAFVVCRESMGKLYEAGAEDAAKRELWDMCIIASGDTPTRKMGGADVSFNDDGTMDVQKSLPIEIVKSIDTEVTADTT